MRSSTHIQDLWDAGGPFIGDNRPCTRVTVEPDWFLNATGKSWGASNKGPFRWFQREDNSQVEVELPNVKSVNWERSTDQIVATANIEVYNQRMIPLDTEDVPDVLGDPGHYWAEHGVSPESQAMWGHQTNQWEGVLAPNALLRTYQGYGGHDDDLEDALADGKLLLTGVWLVDEVTCPHDGVLRLQCRDVGKLLVDQQLYPPLVPRDRYPVRFCRYSYKNKRIRNREVIEDGVNRTPVISSAAPIPVEANPNAAGYWELRNNGQVFGFGDARREKLSTTNPGSPDPNHGGSSSNVNAVAINGHPPAGNGYWVLHSDGRVIAYGDAEHYGDWKTQGVSGNGARDMAPTPSGEGYWILGQNGVVRAYGDAVHQGNVTVTGNNYAQSIESHPTDAGGYWIMKEEGQVTAVGSVSTYAHNGPGTGTAPYGINLEEHEYFTRIRRTSTGAGYWVVSGSGKVRSFGDASHQGQDEEASTRRWAANLYWDIIPYWQTDGGYGLPGSFDTFFFFGDWEHFGSVEEESQVLRRDGNYKDYADIVRRLLLWSGWLLYQDPEGDDYEPSKRPPVFGSVETTGAFSKECLPDDMFDKTPPADAITRIKEAVGYHFFINEEGAAQFRTPNWWAPGNFDENGEYVDTIPEIHDKVQMTSYGANTNDRSLRSEIIVATEDPTEGFDATRYTRFVPFSADLLRGIIKPAMWVNGLFQDEDQQKIMAELIALHIWFSKRAGSVTCAANPNIQIDDQVRIYERVSGETFIHYVRGQSMSHDLDSGAFTMNLTTHWLGDQDDWSITTLGTSDFHRNNKAPCPNARKLVTFEGIANASTGDDNTPVHGHRPSHAFDDDPWSFWLSRGHADPDHFEWIEMRCHGDDINQIYIRPYGGDYTAYISIYEDDRWVRGPDIPASGAAEIPYVKRVGVPRADPEGTVGWYWIMLPRVYRPQKIRITLTRLKRTQWGPNFYRAGIRTLQAGNCSRRLEAGVAHPGYRGPQSRVNPATGVADRQVEISYETLAAVKRFESKRVLDLP